MKNKYIKILLVICVFMFFILPNTYFVSYGYNDNNNTPVVDNSEKVYDFADLFTSDEETELFENIQNYIDKTNFDMVIVTISTNNKNSSMEYADDFYDYNNFGIGTFNDGILFLIDMDNRELWISTTGNAIKKYTDSNINNILDDCYDYISNDNYFKCANQFITSAQKIYSNSNSSSKVSIIKAISTYIFLASFTLPWIIATVFCLVQKSKHRNVKLSTNADFYLDKLSFKITNSEDKFIKTHTSSVPKQSYSSSGGGHGGSSTHTSSSGVHHGGGGRKF